MVILKSRKLKSLSTSIMVFLIFGVLFRRILSTSIVEYVSLILMSSLLGVYITLCERQKAFEWVDFVAMGGSGLCIFASNYPTLLSPAIGMFGVGLLGFSLYLKFQSVRW